MAEKKGDEELLLGGKEYQVYEALVNKDLIKQVAMVLQSMGDINLILEREIKSEEQKKPPEKELSLKEYFLSALKNIFDTIDVVLGWLEYSAKNADSELKKKEGVLRGLYHITALGSHASFVGLLELACKFLDVPENPYKAKREHISACLSDIEDQKQQLSELLSQACNILRDIIREKEFDHDKASEFDNIVKQANDVIKSCKGLLATAEETIEKLTSYMNIMKWFSRGVRFAGFGLTCYGLYHMTPSSSSLDTLANYVTPNQLDLIQKVCFDSKLNVLAMVAACTASGYMWLSLYPSRAYAFHDSLAGLGYKHLRLTKELQSLGRRLNTAVDVMDGVRRTKKKPAQSTPEEQV